MARDWVDVTLRVAMVLCAAAAGGCAGFWLAAEWTNVDDREMTGDPVPYLALTLTTGVGALVAGGLALLALWRWN